MKYSLISLMIFAAAILFVGCTESFAKGGGHGHGMSGNFPLLHANPNTSYGYASPPPRAAGAGGHTGETPFAIPDLGSANVKTMPGRLP